MRPKFICPLIVVEDVERSRRFYQGLLGQRVSMDFTENLTFEGGFSIHLASHYAGLIGGAAAYPRPIGAQNMELYFESHDIERDVAELEAAGVEFVHPLVEQPWGQLVVRCYDPDGHIVEIGEPMEAVVARCHARGMTGAEIAEATSMPVSFVSDVVQGLVE